MYKVFISEKEVSFLSSKHFKQNDLNVFNTNDIFGDRHLFLERKLCLFDSLKIVCENPILDMMTFFKKHKLIQAGGGVVKNDTNFLWIYRNNMWDLPKGKQEPNEEISTTALREVREECGINTGLSIENFLSSTFHTYSIDNQLILKKTDWFLMNYVGSALELKPQLEEGITNVKWLSKDQSIDNAKKSFKSIRTVWDSFLANL